ncbi:MAG: TonB-dependent receptor [Myxococcales bacterium]|nr:TonB-dependent receptor [Myxococcales bacterium]
MKVHALSAIAISYAIVASSHPLCAQEAPQNESEPEASDAPSSDASGAAPDSEQAAPAPAVPADTDAVQPATAPAEAPSAPAPAPSSAPSSAGADQPADAGAAEAPGIAPSAIQTLPSPVGTAQDPRDPVAGAPADAGASLEVQAGAPSGGLEDGPSGEVADAFSSPDARTGSHLPRPRLTVDGASILASPLRTEVHGRDFLQIRRQLGGRTPPDTTTALGLGSAGTLPSFNANLAQLRMQPTLILLNGRRLVATPFKGPGGSDFIDFSQLPITLIDRVEISRGLSGGLYGDGAIGGAYNFITHRDYDGFEVDLGGQATDKLDQHEQDITLTAGFGSKKSGMNAMVSYFTRQPLAARDRDWIAERQQRIESLVSNPGTYQPQVNFVEYPFPDAACQVATDAGHASGLEVRIPLFGEPTTRDGRNVLSDPDLLPTSPIDYQQRFRMDNDMARGDGDGLLEAYETSTFCAGDFTGVQDLTLKDERIQAYTTFWHEFSDHTEAFAELGYYRTRNENRTAPSFPVTRNAPNPAVEDRIVIPTEHADQPIHYPGFSANPDDPPDARTPNTESFIGRAIGLHAGPNINSRRMDVLRGVLGLRGDLEDVGAGSVVETWDWELAGLYTSAQSVTKVTDVLLDKLSHGLGSCAGTTIDDDVGSATYLDEIPSTIKDRQEAGCFNPFYNSVTNNAAIDPLNLSSSSPANHRGFIATDSETNSDMAGFGLQDGGYICDPNDPNSPPCPDELDPDGDGVYELAGTPNTQQVIDGMTGEHVAEDFRSLASVDAVLRGQALEFPGGGLSFGVGGQYRRQTLRIDYDAAYNRRLWAFVFGGPDVPSVARNVGAGFAELRLQMLDGAIELQPAARVEHFDDVGTGINALAAVAIRPFAASAAPPEALEWLLARGHVGRGHRAPSLLQLHGTFTEFRQVEFADGLHFIPQQISGTPDLDFEKYTSFSGGLQWDFAGLHIGADFWITLVDDVIGGDNLQTLLRDCEAQYVEESEDCPEVVLLTGGRHLNHVESEFDNLAEVDSNGIDATISYTLDTKRRRLGDFGTFSLGVQAMFINQYLIKSARALREFYREDNRRPTLNDDGSRDYSGLYAEYDAAGFRNLENFAQPMPKLRFVMPLSWGLGSHTLNLTMRYIGEYHDDSELTIERYGLAPPGTSLSELAFLKGERIPAWMVFDAGYSFRFGDDNWRTVVRVGVINLFDRPPPAAEGPLGYDVALHDPRGRLAYVRATGEF